MASTQQVTTFLKEFKAKVAKDEFVIIEREEYLLCKINLGLSEFHVEQLIFNLTPDEYVKGPEPDDDGSPGQVWVFKPNIEGTNIYLKLKLDTSVAKILSLKYWVD